MTAPKICPLQLAAGKKIADAECVPHRCAWNISMDEDHCAIDVMAVALMHIALDDDLDDFDDDGDFDGEGADDEDGDFDGIADEIDAEIRKVECGGA